MTNRTNVSRQKWSVGGLVSLTFAVVLMGQIRPNPPTAQTVSCSSGPWADITCFGAPGRNLSSIPQTTATTSAKSSTVTLANAVDFTNRQYMVIWKAGGDAGNSTPSAPTVISPDISGSLTVQYKCKGHDHNAGGLTAESPAGSIATAPTLFESMPQQIHSLVQTNGVVAVVMSSPLSPTPVPGEHAHVINVGGAGTAFNGVWPIATVTDSSHWTFNLPGSAGAGSVNSSTTARLDSGVFNIKDGNRTGSTLTFHTDVNHGIQPGARTLITGLSPIDMTGEYVAGQGTTGNTIVFLNTPLYASNRETATVTLGSSIATVYPQTIVSCPALTGTIDFYYIYSDLGTGSFGSTSLIGQSLPGQKTFFDRGNFWTQGYRPNAAYVPTAPTGASQKQMYIGKILAGGGTTTLTVDPPVPTAVTGQVALHDDAQAVIAAGNSGAVTFVSVPVVFNSPITVPYHHNIIFQAPPQINETLFYAGANWADTPLKPTGTSMQFGTSNYIPVTGTANPMMSTTQQAGSQGGVNIRGLLFNDAYNGQNLLTLWGATYSGCDWCAFSVHHSLSIPIVIQGPATSPYVKDTAVFATFDPQLPAVNQPGQIPFGPAIGSIWLKADDGIPSGNMTAGFHMDGHNTLYSRGIFLDFTQNSNSDTSRYIFDVYEDQQPNTPGVMVQGQNVGYGIHIQHFIMDSSAMPVVANWMTNGFYGSSIEDVSVSYGTNVITGFFIPGVYAPNQFPGNPGDANMMLGQNYSFTTNNILGQELLMWGPNPPPIAVQYPRPVITSVSTLSGNLPSGVQNIFVTAVGWNGQETQPSAPFPIRLNGSQGVTANWSPISGVKGYNVYFSSPNCGNKQNSSPITGTTFTFTSFSNYGACGGYDATGLPLIDRTQVATPLLRLTSTKVASLPSAVVNPGATLYVNDSTAITSEGQACIGGSSNGALAVSNGSSWKCF